MSPEVNLTNVAQVILLLKNLRGRLKQLFKKMATIPMRKYFGNFFPISLSIMNVKEQFISNQKVFWQILTKLYDHFFRTWKSMEPKFVLNKGYSLRERKKILAHFSQTTDNDGHWVINCQAPQGILAIMVQVIRSFSYNQWGRKKNCVKKTLFSP